MKERTRKNEGKTRKKHMQMAFSTIATSQTTPKKVFIETFLL
jgi:hypothetical protein